jgi:hypothetical protein
MAGNSIVVFESDDGTIDARLADATMISFSPSMKVLRLCGAEMSSGPHLPLVQPLSAASDGLRHLQRRRRSLQHRRHRQLFLPPPRLHLPHGRDVRLQTLPRAAHNLPKSHPPPPSSRTSSPTSSGPSPPPAFKKQPTEPSSSSPPTASPPSPSPPPSALSPSPPRAASFPPPPLAAAKGLPLCPPP